MRNYVLSLLLTIGSISSVVIAMEEAAIGVHSNKVTHRISGASDYLTDSSMSRLTNGNEEHSSVAESGLTRFDSMLDFEDEDQDPFSLGVVKDNGIRVKSDGSLIANHPLMITDPDYGGESHEEMIFRKEYEQDCLKLLGIRLQPGDSIGLESLYKEINLAIKRQEARGNPHSPSIISKLKTYKNMLDKVFKS